MGKKVLTKGTNPQHVPMTDVSSRSTAAQGAERFTPASGESNLGQCDLTNQVHGCHPDIDGDSKTKLNSQSSDTYYSNGDSVGTQWVDFTPEPESCDEEREVNLDRFGKDTLGKFGITAKPTKPQYRKYSQGYNTKYAVGGWGRRLLPI